MLQLNAVVEKALRYSALLIENTKIIFDSYIVYDNIALQSWGAKWQGKLHF